MRVSEQEGEFFNSRNFIPCSVYENVSNQILPVWYVEVYRL